MSINVLTLKLKRFIFLKKSSRKASEKPLTDSKFKCFKYNVRTRFCYCLFYSKIIMMMSLKNFGERIFSCNVVQMFRKNDLTKHKLSTTWEMNVILVSHALFYDTSWN